VLVLALGAAFAAAVPAAAATLREVRIGRHPDYTRIVFETDTPVRYRVSRDASGELRVRLEASATPRRVGSKSEVLREVAVESEGGAAVARVALAKGDVDVREMVLSDPPRIVLDLSPRAGAKATAVAERKASAAAPAAAPPKPAVARQKSPAREIARAPQPAPRAEPVKPPVESAKPVEEAKPTEEAKPAETAKAPEGAKPAEAAPAPAPTPETTTPAAEPPASESGKPVVASAESRAGEAPGRESARAAPETPAPAREPSTAPRAEPPSPPAPAPGATAGTAPPREVPLELRLAPKAQVGDPTAERLARAERELDALAGLPPKPRRRDAPREPETSAAAEAAPPAATRPGDAPPSPGEAAPRADAPLGAGTGAAAPADPGAPARSQPLAAEPPARKRERPDRHARLQPAPLAPSPLAFMPSPFDDPLVLAGIGALLALIGALALVRRRAARVEDGFKSPFDAAVDLNLAEEAEGAARSGGTAAFEPVSTSAVAPPSPEMGPLFASAAVVSEDDEPSIFDVTAEEAAAEAAGADRVEAAPPSWAAPVREPAAAASAHEDETELTEEEMRLIEELQRRLAHLETRLEEVVDAKERLERHVAAQTEELRVQRAAIARTQRVLRTVVKPDDVATEPVAKT
jgi:hypothetical protein